MSDLAFLLSDTARLMRRRFDERARTIGMTRAQWRTLTVLRRHEGINQAGLAELLEVEPITMGRMIDRLQEAGMVERRADPNDRRTWRIHLRDAAHPVLAQLRILADDLFDRALEGVSTDDQERLAATLRTIRSNLCPADCEREKHHG